MYPQEPRSSERPPVHGVVAAAILALALIVTPGIGTPRSASAAPAVSDREYACEYVDAPAMRSAVVRHTGWGGEQIDNAAAVYRAAAERGLGARAARIGLMAAYQDSRMYNYANFNVKESLEFDYDRIGQDENSLGLFKQRPGGEWGKVRDLMITARAADTFFARLITVEGWESMDDADAAQAVQLSPYPEAYTRFAPVAETVAAIFDERLDCTAIGAWTSPVPGADLWSGFRTSDRPAHDGIDFGAARGREIHAAGTGTVLRVRCNASLLGDDYSCDVDGSPTVSGCGWYVDIQHLDGTVTRYCHMEHRPLVEVGDDVATGEVIGYVGTSGNSSAPHLHFETHTGAPADSSNAVEPTEFMAERGVELE